MYLNGMNILPARRKFYHKYIFTFTCIMYLKKTYKKKKETILMLYISFTVCEISWFHHNDSASGINNSYRILPYPWPHLYEYLKKKKCIYLSHQGSIVFPLHIRTTPSFRLFIYMYLSSRVPQFNLTILRLLIMTTLK